jgi:hypothetical protein
MKLTENTIFITGGGTGIGRGLAEAQYKLGNKVIISGRRKEHLDATTKANPGMDSVELDISEPANIAAVANKLVEDYSALNVLINNAGIMQIDDAAGKIDDQLLTSTSHDELVGADPSDVGLDRAPEKAAKSGRYLQHLGAGVCSPRLNRGLFVHEGGPAFVRPFAALQPQGHAETNFRFDRINFLFTNRNTDLNEKSR